MFPIFYTWDDDGQEKCTDRHVQREGGKYEELLVAVSVCCFKLSVSLNLFLPKIITLAKRSWQLQGPHFPLAIVNNVSVANQLYPVAVHQHTEVI